MENKIQLAPLERNESDFAKLPDRVRFYLLDWKDRHLDEYIMVYDGNSLRNLDIDQLITLFNFVVEEDNKIMKKLSQNVKTYPF